MIEVREARPEEAETLLGLVDALADYERLDRPSPEARTRLIQDGFGESRRFEPHLALLDGEPVGYAITLRTYSSFLALPTLYLEDLFVLPSARGRGVGTAVFRHLARIADREGCGRMEWQVLDWNDLAIGFYERIGARRLGEWQTYRLTAEQFGGLAGR